MADQPITAEHIVAPTAAEDDVLRVEHIGKSFGATTALRDVNLHLRKGEVLGLLGDNGAGKSTLIKILSGFQKPGTGEMWVKGEAYAPKSVDDARAHGIDTVFQDLALIDQLSVYHNLFLRREAVRKPIPFLSNAIMRRNARKALDEIGINIPSIDVPVARLSGGQRQAIAVARTISGDADIILLDEPLAAMGAKEGAMILDLIQRLREEGEVSIIMILHNYVHVFAACDRVSLIQDGVIAFDKPTAETSVDELTEIVVEEYRRARQAAHIGNGDTGGNPRTGAPRATGAASPTGSPGGGAPASRAGSPATPGGDPTTPTGGSPSIGAPITTGGPTTPAGTPGVKPVDGPVAKSATGPGVAQTDGPVAPSPDGGPAAGPDAAR